MTGTEERLATGDAVNVAARLKQAAQPGEILIGADTVGLVRDAATVELPLDAKGKSEPVPAYRLLSLDTEARRSSGEETSHGGASPPARSSSGTPSTTSSNERSCHLFTVLGPAGVGKSRLVAEFLGMIEGDRRSWALPLVRRRHQLLAGRGSRQADPHATPSSTAPRGTRSRRCWERETGATPNEIAWAFRKLLEARAAEEPLLCIFDDIQWGEETFLELIEHVADLSRGAPILLLCMARPELLDRRPTWAGGKLNATTVSLEPLSEEETDELIAGLLEGSALDEGLQTRIRRAAGGNPLYLEEMLAFVGRSSNGDEIEIPPTIHALLAARLDQLYSVKAPRARAWLGRGRGLPPRPASQRWSRTRLPGRWYGSSLSVRKDLVRPETAHGRAKTATASATS